MGLGITQAGSPHNFAVGSVGAEINDTGEICRVCHLPRDHGLTSQSYLNGLLWNHEVSSATYTRYDNAWSSTLTGAQSAQPDGHSKLCLGCHDGTVAMDTFDKYAGNPFNTMRNLHGLSVVPWFSDGSNSICAAPTRSPSPSRRARPATARTSPTRPPRPGPAAKRWPPPWTRAMQCSTCHDVHDQEAVAGTPLLRTAQTTASTGGWPRACA